MTDTEMKIYMTEALVEAVDAHKRGERPFGCVIVDPEGTVIGTGGGSESPIDPTRHSELIAIRQACTVRKGLLYGCTLFSTHEPCLMCTGAILHSKVSTVVWGSCRSELPELFRELISQDRWIDTTHPPQVVTGVMRDSCLALFAQEVAHATRAEF